MEAPCGGEPPAATLPGRPPRHLTIFGVEDFVPRKGVMTRYAKKMVRPDMYGLVVVRGLLGESGAS